MHKEYSFDDLGALEVLVVSVHPLLGRVETHDWHQETRWKRVTTVRF